MPTAENAILYYESGQSAVAMVALTDSGDQTIYNSADELWSKRSGYAPNVKPQGLATGGIVTPAALGGNDDVDVAGLTCYIAGVLTTIGADADVEVGRGADANICMITSITITAAGAIAAVEGAPHTAFSATRGANGGPPWIPLTSIEIAQVKVNSTTPAPITADEIFQVVGSEVERFDYPTWEERTATVSNQILGLAGVTFNSALPEIHSADAGSTTFPKKVYASYYEPLFAAVPKAKDFVRPANSKSVSSAQYYGGTVGSVTTSLGQGSFGLVCQDGVTDGILKLEGELLWFKFKPDRLNNPYILAQGYLGITETFGAGANIEAACTISAETQGLRVAS